MNQKRISQLILGGGLLFCFLAGPALAVQAKSPLFLNVPFTSQAPLGQWSDLRQEDGCEEATAAMAMAWVKDQTGQTKTWWRNRVVGLSDFELRNYGEYRDVSLSDMVKWLFVGYYAYNRVAIKPVNTAADIISELEAGKIVLIPMDGRLLLNPYYTPPGPQTHMLLVKGYDYASGEFITNDSGTRRGESYRYPAKILLNAIRVYPTGSHEPVKKIIKEMIVISKTGSVK